MPGNVQIQRIPGNGDQKFRNQKARANSAHGKQYIGNQHGDNAANERGHDKIANGIYSQSRKGVHFGIDGHGSYHRRECRAAASRDQKSGQNRSDFANNDRHHQTAKRT